jgi:hypothetical protein
MTKLSESDGAVRNLTIAINGATVLEISVEDLTRASDTAIPSIMGKQ